MNNGLNHIEKQ